MLSAPQALARIIKTSRMLSNWTKVSALCQRAESSMLAATGSAEQERYDAEAASEAVPVPVPIHAAVD